MAEIKDITNEFMQQEKVEIKKTYQDGYKIGYKRGFEDGLKEGYNFAMKKRVIKFRSAESHAK